MKQFRFEIIAGITGLLFGFGLAYSDMINPATVLGFLEIFGNWDQRLLFVMGGALLVTLPGFALTRRRTAPVCDVEFARPNTTLIDRPLIAGAMLFGLGWGLAGLCPGPAIVNLGSLQAQAFIFVASMLAGMGLFSVTSSKH